MIKLMRNQNGFSVLLVLLSVVLVTGIAVGAYYLGINKNNKLEQAQLVITNQNTPQSTQNINQTQTTAMQDKTTNWKIYNISECLVTFKYPVEWQNYLSNKDKCKVHYTKPVISGQLMDTFIIFDVQPEFFLGQQNIKIRENEVINKTTLNGIEKTITYSEEKDRTRPLYLANKDFFFRKGPIYFRIVSQYEKGDKDFEDTLDKIAESVVMDGDEAFYTNYVKNLESELSNFVPKNK